MVTLRTSSEGGSTTGFCANVGNVGCGVVFKLDPTGHETVLYSFTGGTDGGYPTGVVRDRFGNLYGTTVLGGITTGACAPSGGCGVVFKLDPTGHETVLYSFTGGSDGGGTTRSGVIGDSAGNLYGTTFNGGTANAGAVYKLDPAGHKTVLYTFSTGADGDIPKGDLAGDGASNLYGTTQQGGAAGQGVVSKVDSAGHETVLYSFTGGPMGRNQVAV
jgi:uncharacterized repeat protein (TIGR03803 family)